MKLLPITEKLPATPRLPETEAIRVLTAIDEEVIEAAHRLYIAVMQFYHGGGLILATFPMPSGLAASLFALWRAKGRGDIIAIRQALQETVSATEHALLIVDTAIDVACSNARCALKRAERVEEGR